MNHLLFSVPLKKGMQAVAALTILLFSLGPGGTSVVYAAPPNDDFASATLITGLTYNDALSTTQATEDVTDPNPVGPCTDGYSLEGGHKTVWYKYTPLVNESIQVDTTGSNYDTYISVFTGSEGSLTLIKCNDDDLIGLTSQLSFIGTGGTQYFIEVAQFKCKVGDCLNPQPATGGNLEVNVNITNIDVTIGTTVMGRYYVAANNHIRDDYMGVDSGPVKVKHITGIPLVAGLNEIWKNNGTPTSSFQMMGLPSTQLSDTYYFPAYNNVTLNEQVRFGNVDTVDTNVTVTIGTTVFGPYLVHPNQQLRFNYAGVDSGPVKVQSSGGAKITAAIRDAWFTANAVESFSQLMGLPAGQLSNTYYFPSYNNVTLNEQLRFGNVGNADTNVTVKIGTATFGPYLLHPSEQFRINYAGVDSGPVVVQGSDPNVPIIAAIREAWMQSGYVKSWIQLMGLPGPQLSDTYYFPAYDNFSLNGQLRFGNVGAVNTNVTVTIGGTPFGPYLVHPNEQLRFNYAGVNSGPVKVQSSGGVKIIAALRDALLVNGLVESFAQMMGLPGTQISDTYMFPAYNNVTLSEEVRVGVP